MIDQRADELQEFIPAENRHAWHLAARHAARSREDFDVHLRT